MDCLTREEEAIGRRIRDEVLQPAPLNDLVAVRATLRLMVDIVTLGHQLRDEVKKGSFFSYPLRYEIDR
jgi:hypothetical protein